MARKRRAVNTNPHATAYARTLSYSEALDDFFSHGGTITQCPPALTTDDEWNSLRDYLEPYKTCLPEASRWSLGASVAAAIRECVDADIPMNEETE